MAQIITFANQKGGVGKTSIAMNFGIGIKQFFPDKRVLFVDMDPQCSLTFIMGVDESPCTIYDVLTGTANILESIVHAEEGDIICASPNLSSLESMVVGTDRELCLKKALIPLMPFYDFIIIDSQPMLSFLTVNNLSAADTVIIPALADVFSLQGIGQLYDTIQSVRLHSNPDLKIAGIVLSRYNERASLNRESKKMLMRTAKKIGTRVFDTTIREGITIREAQASRMSIFKYTEPKLIELYSRYCRHHSKEEIATYLPKANQRSDYENLVREYLISVGRWSPYDTVPCQRKGFELFLATGKVSAEKQ